MERCPKLSGQRYGCPPLGLGQACGNRINQCPVRRRPRVLGVGVETRIAGPALVALNSTR